MKIVHVATVDMKAIDAVLRGDRDDKVHDALRVLDIMLREHAAKRLGVGVPVGYGSCGFC